MNDRDNSLFRQAIGNQRGQVLPWVALMMVLLLGMGAFALDIGHAFYCYRELQAATDADCIGELKVIVHGHAEHHKAGGQQEQHGQDQREFNQRLALLATIEQLTHAPAE